MIVVTLLVSDRQVQRVNAATPAPHRVLHASSGGEMYAMLRQEPADVLVLDPVAARSAQPGEMTSDAELVALGTEYSYLPVVFYASRPAIALRLVARFPTRERCEALVLGFDDDPRSIRDAIHSVVSATLAAPLVRRLSPVIGDAQLSLARTIRAVFSRPSLFGTVHDVAKAACMCRRTLDRRLHNHGIVTGAELLEVARAFVAVRQMRSGAGATYAAGGPRRPEKLGAFIARTVGVSVDQLVASSDAEFVERFIARLQRVRADGSCQASERRRGRR